MLNYMYMHVHALVCMIVDCQIQLFSYSSQLANLGYLRGPHIARLHFHIISVQSCRKTAQDHYKCRIPTYITKQFRILTSENGPIT